MKVAVKAEHDFNNSESFTKFRREWLAQTFYQEANLKTNDHASPQFLRRRKNKRWRAQSLGARYRAPESGYLDCKMDVQFYLSAKSQKLIDKN